MKPYDTRDDEEQFREVVSALKSLKKVDAPDGFEANLLRRINQETLRPKESILKRFFTEFSLAHSVAGVGVAGLIVMFVFLSGSNTQDQMLFVDPKPREDVMALKTDDMQPYDFHMFSNKKLASEDKVTEQREPSELYTRTVVESDEESVVSSPPPAPNETSEIEQPTVAGYSGGSGRMTESESNKVADLNETDVVDNSGSVENRRVVETTTNENNTRTTRRRLASMPTDNDNIEKVPYTGRSEVNYRAQYTTVEERHQLDSLRNRVFSRIDSTAIQY